MKPFCLFVVAVLVLAAFAQGKTLSRRDSPDMDDIALAMADLEKADSHGDPDHFAKLAEGKENIPLVKENLNPAALKMIERNNPGVIAGLKEEIEKGAEPVKEVKESVSMKEESNKEVARPARTSLDNLSESLKVNHNLLYVVPNGTEITKFIDYLLYGFPWNELMPIATNLSKATSNAMSVLSRFLYKRVMVSTPLLYMFCFGGGHDKTQQRVAAIHNFYYKGQGDFSDLIESLKGFPFCRWWVNVNGDNPL